MPKTPKIYFFSIIMLMGTVLRLILIAHRDFWFDEAFTFFLARNPIAAILTASAAENTPPLYYLLLRAWMQLGHSPFVLRLISFFPGIISIGLIYLLGRRILSPSAGLIAAAWLAFSPLHVYYSSELRMYSLWTAEALLALILFHLVLTGNKTRSWLGLGIVLMIALYTHYLTALLIGCLLLYLLSNRLYRPQLLPFLIMSGLILIAYLPWIRTFFRSPHPAVYGLGPLLGLGSTVSSYILGGAGDITLKTMFAPGVPWLLKAIWLIGLSIGFYYAVVAMVRHTRHRYAKLLVVLSVVPLLVMSVISAVRPVFSPRTMIIFAPAVYLLAAAELSRRPRRQLILIGVVMLLVSSTALFARWLVPELNREPWKMTADWIANQYEDGDVVAHASLFTYYPSRFYHRDQWPEFLVLTSTLTPTVLSRTGPQPSSLAELAAGRFRRIWFIDVPDRAYPEEVAQAYLFLSSFHLIRQERINSIQVTLYEI